MSISSSHKSPFPYTEADKRRLSSSGSRPTDERDQHDLMSEIKEMVTDFKWYDNTKLVEDDDMAFLDGETQRRNQDSFTKNNIKIFGRHSNPESQRRISSERTNSDKGFRKVLQESPQMLDDDDEEEEQDDNNDDEDEEDDDPDYEEKDQKVTELGLEYDSDYDEDSELDEEDEEEQEKWRRRSKSWERDGDIFKDLAQNAQSIMNSKAVQFFSAVTMLAVAIVIVASIIARSNNVPRYQESWKSHHTQYIPVDSLSEVNSKLRKFHNDLENLSERQISYFTTNDKLAGDMDELRKNVVAKWEQLNKKFVGIQNELTSGRFVDHDSLDREFQPINKKLKSLETTMKRSKEIDVDHSNHLNDIFKQVSEFEAKLDTANKKIDELVEFETRATNVLDTLEEDIIQSVLSRLPSMIPITATSDGQLQLAQEVYDYLSEVISHTVKQQLDSLELDHATVESDLSWENFLQRNQIDLNQYLAQYVSDDLKLVKRQDFEQILIDNFKANRMKVDKELQKIRKTVDQYVNDLDSKISRIAHTKNTADEIDRHHSSTSQVLIEHLIDKKLDQNKLKIDGRANYADAEQGATIINTLTSKGIKEHLRKRKSFIHRALFGWYDFLTRLTSGGHQPLGKLIDNPKNALTDNKSYWVALKDDCHLGVRLSKEVYLVDILFQHPRNDNPLILTSAPRKISIYVKPTNSKDLAVLRQTFEKQFDQNFIPQLSAFVKISEFEYDINNAHIYQFAQLPKEYLQLDIATREVYIEIESNWGHEHIVSLHNIKIFGLNNDDVEMAKNLLDLDSDASTEEVANELRHRFVDRATYVVNQAPDYDKDELTILGQEK